MTMRPFTKRYVSGPASALLRQADLSPVNVDDALEQLVRGTTGAVLRKRHPLLQQIGHTTGINVVQIGRRSRYLLIQIEQNAGDRAGWQYRELTPRSCTFSCRGQLPTDIGLALSSELLDKLVRPAEALRDIVIKTVGETGDGWLNVDVVPSWHLF